MVSIYANKKGDQLKIERPSGTCRCLRCGWEWLARTLTKPRRCANPKCRTPYWDSVAVVYVSLQDEGQGIYKIGCTEHLRQRYQSSSMRASILFEIPVRGHNKFTVERAIHTLFAHRRLNERAEAFRLTEEDLATLRQLSIAPDPFVLAQQLATTSLDDDNLAEGETVLRCARCGYQWPPRVPKPTECPNCKSRYWADQVVTSGINIETVEPR